MKTSTTITLLFLISWGVQAQHTWQWGKRGGSYTTHYNGTPFREPVIDMATDPNGNVYIIANVGGEGLDVDGTTLNFHFSADYYGYIERYKPGGLLMSYDCNGTFRWSKLISGTYSGMTTRVETDTLGHVYVTAWVAPAIKDIWGTEYRAHFDTDTIIPYSPDPREYKQRNYFIQYDTLGTMKRFHSPQPDNVHFSGANYTVRMVDFVADPNGKQHYFIYARDYEHNGFTYRPVLEGDTLTRGEYILKYDVQGNYLGNIKLDMTLTGLSVYPLKINHDPVRKAYYMSGWNGTPNNGNYQDSLWIGGQLVNHQMFAAKFDNLGNKVWLKQGENQYGLFEQRPEIDHQGNIYLFGSMSAVGNPAGTATFNGYTASNTIKTNSAFPVLIKMNADGNLIWGTNGNTNSGTKSQNGVLNGDIIEFSDSHGGIAWDNFSIPPEYNSGYDVYHARFDRHTGNILSLDTLASNWGFSEYSTAMTADRRGNVYIGGEFQGSMYVGSDTLTNIHSGGIGTDFFLVKSGQANCNCVLPEAAFSYSGTQRTVDFTYTGTSGYDRLEWEFGDDTMQTTTGGTASHTFGGNIDYWVCVTAYNSCGYDTWCAWVDPNKLTVPELSKDSFTFYPNPMVDELTVETTESLFYTLFDLTGKTLKKGVFNLGKNTLDTTRLSEGLYMLQLKNNRGNTRVVRLVKE